MRLAENTGHKKSPKICHLSIIAQLCWAISSQLRHVSTPNHHTTTVLRPFFPDHPGEPVLENVWTLWSED